MDDLNFSHVAAGDTVTFRCGGEVTVQKVKISSDGDYFISIEVCGYHCHGTGGWTYDATGTHGEGTGPQGEAPFDILKIEREAVTIHLIPKE